MVIYMKAIETALSLTQAYKLGIERFEKMLGNEFAKAVEFMNNTSTHIIVCGMGKSGLVGRKISSTLASTGTPSIFLHPAEAIHGDLGKVQKKSVVLLISYSGETGEIIALIPALKRLDVNIIALTGVKNSTLANISDIVLDTSVDREACPLNLAPTTSTMITMVLGDALAVSLMELKNFKQEDFALTHPGGSLGKRLLSSVKDEMKQNNLPFIDQNSIVQDVLVKMTEGRLGLALVGGFSHFQHWHDGSLVLCAQYNFLQQSAGCWDVLFEPFFAFVGNEVAVGADRLHESLDCALDKDVVEWAFF